MDVQERTVSLYARAPESLRTAAKIAAARQGVRLEKFIARAVERAVIEAERENAQ